MRARHFLLNEFPVINNYEVKSLPFTKDLGDFIKANHYSKSYLNSVKYCFGLFEGEILIGVCTFSNFSRNQATRKYERKLELSRFVLKQPSLPNTATYFMGYCLRWLKKKTQLEGIISYADPTEGHSGTIYKASNFTLLGKTSPSYHYTLNEERIHKKKVWRDAKKLGLTERQYALNLSLVRVPEESKLVFYYQLRDPSRLSSFIYVIKNKVNNKIYVGRTTSSVERRFQRHVTDARNGSPLLIHKAMRSLGFSKFYFEVLDKAKNEIELQQKESYWIETLKSYLPEIGYNMERGYSADSYTIPDEVIFQSFKLRQEGVQVLEIAERLGVSPDYLGTIHSGKIKPHLLNEWESLNGKLPTPRVFSIKEKLEIRSKYFTGQKMSQLAKEFDTSKNYIRCLLNGTIDPEGKELFEKNYGPLIIKDRTRTESELESIFTDYFLKKLDQTHFETTYGIGSMSTFINRQKKKSFFKGWSKANSTRRQERKIDQDTWFEIFELKAKAIPTQVLSKRYGIALNWMNQVLRGDMLPDVRRAWDARGGATPKRFRKLETGWRIESKTMCFQTPKHAADYLGVTPQAIIKAIKNKKSCKGILFWYVDPYKN